VAQEREAEELCLAEGVFPALLSGCGGSIAARSDDTGAGGCRHRVLLVDSRTRRVKVESDSRSVLEIEVRRMRRWRVSTPAPHMPPPPGTLSMCVCATWAYDALGRFEGWWDGEVCYAPKCCIILVHSVELSTLAGT
jgi:hypothetical protein